MHTRTVVAACAALALTVSACGSNGPTDPETATAADDAADGAGDGTPAGGDVFPASVEHRYGTTEVPAPPERVVTVGLTDHDPVLALGVQPVGITAWITETEPAAWSADAIVGDGPTLLPTTEIDFEQVASLEPDLILAMYSSITEEEFDTLSQIAPTVAQPADHADYTAPWEEYTRLAGAALGLGDEAEQLIAETEDVFAAARDAHPELSGLAGVAGYDFGADALGVYASGDPRSRMLTSLGLETPAAIDDLADGEFYAALSLERITVLDEADVVLWCGTAEPFVTAQAVYQGLDLVAEGRDLYLDCNDPVGVAMSYSSVLSLPFAIDELAPQLAAAADGDPATTP